jgi:hypothetical protein
MIAAASGPRGLTSGEARRRLAELGPNTVAEEAPSSFMTLFEKFWGPVPWLLEAAIVLQLSLGAYIEAAVIATLLLLNATLGVVQQGRAGAALAALKKRLAPAALVLRDGEWVRRPAEEASSACHLARWFLPTAGSCRDPSSQLGDRLVDERVAGQRRRRVAWLGGTPSSTRGSRAPRCRLSEWLGPGLSR